MKIKFKKLNDNAVVPAKAHSADAGFDLVCVSAEEDRDVFTYKTGIGVSIPEGFVGLLCSRSSVYKYDLIQCNCVGIIDATYHGDLTFKFRKSQPFAKRYQVGDKIGQLVIVPLPEVELEEVDDLGDSERGDNGFGSTGV